MKDNVHDIVKKYMDKDKVRLFDSIVGKRSFEKLVQMLGSLDDQKLGIIFSSEKAFNRHKVLSDRVLNRGGLHIFRILLAESLKHERRRLLGIKDDVITSTLDTHGCVVIENFLDEQTFSKIENMVMNQRVLDNLPGWRHPKTGWNSHYKITKKNKYGPMSVKDIMWIFDNFYKDERLLRIVGSFCGTREVGYNHMHIEKMVCSPNDPQSETHIDTFFSSIKFWLFLNDVFEDNGPFCYSIGSCQNTKEKLMWEYEQSINALSLKNKSSIEGSFRINNKDLTRKLGFAGPKKIVVKKNSLVLQNNRGFHRRHNAEPGKVRVGVYGDFRALPFSL